MSISRIIPRLPAKIGVLRFAQNDSTPKSSLTRHALVPLCRLLVGMSEPQHGRIGSGLAGDLQSHGQLFTRESAGNLDAGSIEHAEGRSVAQQISCLE